MQKYVCHIFHSGMVDMKGHCTNHLPQPWPYIDKQTVAMAHCETADTCRQYQHNSVSAEASVRLPVDTVLASSDIVHATVHLQQAAAATETVCGLIFELPQSGELVPRHSRGYPRRPRWRQQGLGEARSVQTQNTCRVLTHRGEQWQYLHTGAQNLQCLV